MKHGRSGRKWVVFAPVLIAGLVLLLGWVVMLLWNAILPAVTGVKLLSYWQAVGLLVLSKILFGGFRGGGGREHWKAKRRREWKERWMHMSDEEKLRFRDEWKRRCGPQRGPHSGPQSGPGPTPPQETEGAG